MDIATLTNSEYLRILVVGIFVYLGDVFLIIEKINQRIQEVKNKHDQEIKLKLKEQTPDALIFMFDSLRKSRLRIDQIDAMVNLNIIGGIATLVGCFVGFLLQIANLPQDLAISVVIVGFVLFSISIIFLVYWYLKKSDASIK
ncbi:MAG: hypothetical protein AABX47_09320 [Nanoarchaeota archaeon]